MIREKPILFYTGYVLLWTLAISAAGALVGAIVYPIGGKLFGIDGTLIELARRGAGDLAFIAFIWAPGIGIVLAFRHAYRRRQSGADGSRSARAADSERAVGS